MQSSKILVVLISLVSSASASFPIQVQLEDGRIFGVDVDAADTIARVKAKIAQTASRSVSKFRLTNQGIGLADSKTLDYYKIRESDLVKMVAHDRIKVLVECPSNETWTLVVAPSDTILVVKQKLARYVLIPIQQQYLAHNEVALTDNQRTLQELGLKDGDRIRLFGDAVVHIFVRDSLGDIKSIQAQVSSTVDHIKDKVAADFGLEVANIKLRFADRLLESGKSLLDYGIASDSTISLD